MHGVTNSARIELALLGHPAVADCAVLERRTPAGERTRVAYVVPAAAATIEELSAFLRARDPEHLIPDLLVPVSAIPLTADGRVDYDLLASFEIVDDALALRWTDAARSLPAVVRAVAVVQECERDDLPLHLADLIPGFATGPRAPAAPASAASIACVTPRAESRAAISDGGPVAIGRDDPRTLGGLLHRAAGEPPPAGLVYVDRAGAASFQSYAMLRDEARRLVSGLRACGLRPGDRVVLQLERQREMVETIWACVLGGFVPVPHAVAPAYDRPSPQFQALVSVWDLINPGAIVTSRAIQPALQAAVAGSEVRDAQVLILEDLRGTPDADAHEADPDDAALLMLTSGSTGTPKAVTLSHRNLIARSTASRQMNGFSAGDVTLNWMPLDHVAGLIYFHLRDVFLTCRQIHVPTDRVLHDPLHWLDDLDRHRATVTFAPNFAYGLINDRAAVIARRTWDLSSVRCVLNGAEAIVARTARMFLRLLAPHGLSPTTMRPAWGMSETSSGVTYDDQFSLDSTTDDDPFVAVGRPIPGVSIRIVNASGQVVSEGTIGRLQIRGAPVTSGYFGDEALSRTAFTSDGWFLTGDLGIISEGRLTVTGREKDVVIVNSVNYYCHAIEAAVETIEDVEPSFTAACAVRPAGAQTDSLAIFFRPRPEATEPLGDLVRRVRSTVGGQVGVAPEYVVPLEGERIPKTSVGKIRREELGRSLMSGEFDDVLKHVDRVTRNANTVPAWFYRKVWHPRAEDDLRAPDPNTTALIFLDESGIGRELERELIQRGVRVVTVSARQVLEDHDREQSAHAIDPARVEDYHAILRRMTVAGHPPTHVVHLWGCDAWADSDAADGFERAQQRGALSVMRLAQALAPLGNAGGHVSVVFGATGVQRVHAADPIACANAPVLGLLKSLAQEMPWLRCRHVDLPPGAPSDAARSLAREMFAVRQEREIAYRSKSRFVARLERVAFDTVGTGRTFERDAFYLVTGGLGGIGTAIARLMLERFNAHLLLIGRGELDGARADALRDLRTAGGTVAYEPADVCDADAVAAIVSCYEARLGRPLRGVIHLAGTYRERLIVDEDQHGVLTTLRPKSVGTANMYRLLCGRHDALLVCGSSLAGFFGGATIGAYAAASAYQDAFAEGHAGGGSVRCCSLGWSNWDGIGHSRALVNRDLPRSRGYEPMPAHDALHSLLVGVASGHASLITGVDGDHRHIRRYRTGDAGPLKRVTVYYEATATREARVPETSPIVDAFGTLSRPAWVRLAALPLTPAGDVDASQLGRAGRGRRAHRQGPRTDFERELALLWGGVLGVVSVSIDDNFFDCGGDSLLAARLVGGIRERFGVALGLRDIFDAPTLAALGQAIALAPKATGPDPTDQDADLLGDPERLLAALDGLGDDEVDGLLRRLASEGAEGDA